MTDTNTTCASPYCPYCASQRYGHAAPAQQGCVCPPGAEKTCQGPMCPRRPIGPATSFGPGSTFVMPRTLPMPPYHFQKQDHGGGSVSSQETKP